jgi:hypothetical protein
VKHGTTHLNYSARLSEVEGRAAYDLLYDLFSIFALFFGNTEPEFGELWCDKVINESFLLSVRGRISIVCSSTIDLNPAPESVVMADGCTSAFSELPFDLIIPRDPLPDG